MALPKIEGLIRLSAATIIGTFGGSVITIPAGDYYLNSASTGARSFLDELEFQIDAALGAGSSCTVDDDTDSSTGKVTMSRGGAFAVTWTSTTLRDYLGYTGNLGAATSHLSSNHARTLWLPNTGRSGVMAPEGTKGAVEVDGSISIAPSGKAYSLVGTGTSRRVDTLDFRMVKGFKTWIELESVTNESFERFWLDSMAQGLPLMFYKDRATDGTHRELVVDDFWAFKPTPENDSWVGTQSLWNFKYAVRERV